MGSKSSVSESVMKAFSHVLTNMKDMWWCTTVRTTTLFVDMFFFSRRVSLGKLGKNFPVTGHRALYH